MAWIDLPEFPQVVDIPPATYWWKDHLDRYTIHLLGDKEGKVIAARLSAQAGRSRQARRGHQAP